MKMKVQQGNLPFRPVTIKLEKKYEAEALFNLIDKIETYSLSLTSCESELVRKLSNARTNQEVII